MNKVLTTLGASVCLCTVAAAADDIVGVGWNGNAYAIDSTSGVGTLLGATGFTGLNSMAKHPDGKLYALTSTGEVITIDPGTGAGTSVSTCGVADPRGAAFRADGVLYVIGDVGTGSFDRLYEVDVATGGTTLVGTTDAYGLQALAVGPTGTVYAWDCGSNGTNGLGLCVLDPATWTASDVNPSTVGTASEVQALCFDDGGQLYGLRYEVRRIDVLTDTHWNVAGSGWEVRGAEFVGSAEPGAGYCFGDPGFGISCPCGNDNDGSVPGSGCANGFFLSGAHLAGSGVASLGADTLVLACSYTEPNQSGLYFQADNDLSPGIIWGDGLRCAGGALKRLGVRFSDAAGSSNTSGLPLPISVKAGNITAGQTKYYQCWYRNPDNAMCGAKFNASNGYAVTWGP